MTKPNAMLAQMQFRTNEATGAWLAKLQAELRSALEDLQLEVSAQFEADLHKLFDDLSSDFSGQVADLGDQAQEELARLEALMKQMELLKTGLGDLNGKGIEAEGRLQALIEGLRSQLDRAEGRAADLLQTFAGLPGILQDLKAAKNRLTELEVHAAKGHQCLVELIGSAQQLQHQGDQSAQHLVDLLARAEAQGARQGQVDDRVQDLQHGLAVIAASLGGMQTQGVSFEANLADLVRKVEDASASQRDLATTIQRIDSRGQQSADILGLVLNRVDFLADRLVGLDNLVQKQEGMLASRLSQIEGQGATTGQFLADLTRRAEQAEAAQRELAEVVRGIEHQGEHSAEGLAGLLTEMDVLHQCQDHLGAGFADLQRDLRICLSQIGTLQAAAAKPWWRKLFGP